MKKKKSSEKKPSSQKPASKKPVPKKPEQKKLVPNKPKPKKPATQKLTASLSGEEPPVNKKPAPKQLVANKSDEYEKFRLLLVDLQRRLKGDVNMLSAEALGGLDAESGDNRAPIHPAEVGTHSFEQEFTLNRLSDDGDRLERIEAALDRIEEGIYGACEECGGRIPKARLEVLPDTPYCVKCASSLGG